jgi:hypothetical protein
MELTCFHQYIGGDICSKIKKSVCILNRQCGAMLAAPIMGHNAIFTLLVCTILAHFFTLTITFKGMGCGVGMGRLPFGQV